MTVHRPNGYPIKFLGAASDVDVHHNRLVSRVRDYAQVRAEGRIDLKTATEAFALLEIDSLGLEPVDRLYLEAVIDKFQGGPVGLNSIAVAIQEDQDTILDYVEPYLIQIGFLKRTARGRVLGQVAFAHLSREYNPRPDQLDLF